VNCGGGSGVVELVLEVDGEPAFIAVVVVDDLRVVCLDKC